MPPNIMTMKIQNMEISSNMAPLIPTTMEGGKEHQTTKNSKHDDDVLLLLQHSNRSLLLKRQEQQTKMLNNSTSSSSSNNNSPPYLSSSCSHVSSSSFSSSFSSSSSAKTTVPAITNTKANNSNASSSSQLQTQKFLLPEDYVPSPYSVILGRGKKCTNACGNRRLNIIASMYIDRYSNAADDKDEKTKIVSEIYNTVLSANIESSFNKRGAFIRPYNEDVGRQEQEERWCVADECNAREKIGKVLRDLLHENYRSSSKSKIEIRRQQRRRKNNRTTTTNNISMMTTIMETEGIQSRGNFVSSHPGSGRDTTSASSSIESKIVLSLCYGRGNQEDDIVRTVVPSLIDDKLLAYYPASISNQYLGYNRNNEKTLTFFLEIVRMIAKMC